MEKVALRPATQEDTGFVSDVKTSALGEYVRETYGWDEDERWRHLPYVGVVRGG